MSTESRPTGRERWESQERHRRLLLLGADLADEWESVVREQAQASVYEHAVPVFTALQLMEDAYRQGIAKGLAQSGPGQPRRTGGTRTGATHGASPELPKPAEEK